MSWTIPGSPSSISRMGAPAVTRAATASSPCNSIRAASRSVKAPGTRIGKPGWADQAGRTISPGVEPCASTSDVTVSGSTQAYRYGHSSPAVVSLTAARAARWPCTNQAIPRGSSEPGRVSVTGRSAMAAASLPSSSSATTTIGSAPPDHAAWMTRRIAGSPSASDSAATASGARTMAATVNSSLLSQTSGSVAPDKYGGEPALKRLRSPLQRVCGTIQLPMSNSPSQATPLNRSDQPAPAAGLAIRTDVRNLAIVAHVDHGKTTLVDAMLRQSGAFRANAVLIDRVMDSNDLEREKGITILAKQTSVEHDGIRLNIDDTPGHADFGGEVERSLNMVDSVLLPVDAAEGPLPQTRYVLQKAMSHHLPVVVAINKIDRSDARCAEVLDDIYELFMDLGADEQQIEFPVVYTNAKTGTSTMDLATPGTDLRPLFDLLIEHTPAPVYEPGHPLHLLVTNLSANGYVGRRAVGRVWNGTIKIGQRILLVPQEDEDAARSIEPGRTVTLSGVVTTLRTAHGIEQVDIEEAAPGDIVSLAGIPDVTIGDTITDPADPRPMSRLDVDEPTLSMTFGANTSPLSGREGKYVTTRHIKQRLEREVLGNVSIEFSPTDSADTYEVRGRGELQLAILIEQMRREGYELQVSRPEVILRQIDGHVHEPYERITVDIPPEFIGPVQGALSDRKGALEQMSTDADGRVRMEYVIPVRGLIGFRGQLLTETRGTALMHQIGEGYGPWAGEVTHRTSGVVVADRSGTSNAYALFGVQERSALFIGSGVNVYEGMIIGENARADDMDVNATKEKKQTNMRTHSHDEALHLTPHRELTLEAAIEFIGGDELVEVTPKSIRLRKRVLTAHDRKRLAGKEYEQRMTD